MGFSPWPDEVLAYALARLQRVRVLPGERRSARDRRQSASASFSPERRSGRDRRSGIDRRRRVPISV